jgi:amidase
MAWKLLLGVSVYVTPHFLLSPPLTCTDTVVGWGGYSIQPLANSARDLELFCRVVLASEPWRHEPQLIEIPWKTDVQTPSKLRIGLLACDGIVRPHPPLQKALAKAKAKLIAAGHEVVDWAPFRVREAWELYVSPAPLSV